MKKILSLLILFFASLATAQAWLYPEHRDIMLKAIRDLKPEQRKILDGLWTTIRTRHEARLCANVIDTSQGVAPQCLDYAAWPAIAGDHSCSPGNLTDEVLNSDWILKVADVAAQLKVKLAAARNHAEKNNAMREADMKLLRVDHDYATRASGNNAHFKLALPDISTTAAEYMAYCLKSGSPVNLTGIYLWFHACALEKANLLRQRGLTDDQRYMLTLMMLADEAFAIHFIEDSFASGHVAGVWGDASQRKGTHDHYNEEGYQVTTWDGERMVIMGDAYMRPQDEERCARTVQLSLGQMLDIFTDHDSAALKFPVPAEVIPDTFNVCADVSMPNSALLSRSLLEESRKVLMTTPVPGLASGPGAMPRMSTELGPFIGIATGVRGSVINHGFSTYQKTVGFVPGLEIALRMGLGLEGLLNQSSDGLSFLDFGWRLDGSSNIKIENDSTLKQLGGFASAIPSRAAFFLRLRLPFYLIPGDLFILAPLLYIVNPTAMNKVVATAGNGGLIPWQQKMITSAGTFQFVLGREVVVSFYGFGNGRDAYLLPTDNKFDGVFCALRSTQIQFPIMEYSILRSYASRQSGDLLLQIYGGVDFPGKRTVLFPVDGPFPPVGNIYFAGIRFAFDYRHYFGGRK